MPNPFVFMSAANEENEATETGNMGQGAAPPPEDGDKEELVYTIVFAGVGGISPGIFRQMISSFDWNDFLFQLIMIFLGVHLGLRIGFRLFANQHIKFSFRAVFYGLFVLLTTITPLSLYLLIKNI